MYKESLRNDSEEGIIKENKQSSIIFKPNYINYEKYEGPISELR